MLTAVSTALRPSQREAIRLERTRSSTLLASAMLKSLQTCASHRRRLRWVLVKVMNSMVKQAWSKPLSELVACLIVVSSAKTPLLMGSASGH